jgi:hypothetical protein
MTRTTSGPASGSHPIPAQPGRRHDRTHDHRNTEKESLISGRRPNMTTPGHLRRIRREALEPWHRLPNRSHRAAAADLRRAARPQGEGCTHWALNPHLTLIESGWVEQIHSFGGEVGMEDYISARSDVYFTSHDGTLRSNRLICQTAGLYACDMFSRSFNALAAHDRLAYLPAVQRKPCVAMGCRPSTLNR